MKNLIKELKGWMEIVQPFLLQYCHPESVENRFKKDVKRLSPFHSSVTLNLVQGLIFWRTDKIFGMARS